MSLWRQSLFKNRSEAGQQLAKRLSYLCGKDVVVIAVVRGGVPVAYEVALELGAHLQPAIVQKIGVPEHAELAMGAIVDADVPEVFWNEDVVYALCTGSDCLRNALADAREKLAKRRRQYSDALLLPLKGRTVIVVDDGIATGASMHAVLKAVRKQKPDEVVLAVPVILGGTRRDLERLADTVICLERPTDIHSVGEAYNDFSPISHAEVRKAIELALVAYARRPRQQQARPALSGHRVR